MLLVDTKKGEIIDDNDIKMKYALQQPYGEWLEDNMMFLHDIRIPNKADIKYSDEELTKLQNEQDFTSLMIRAEELKTMPFGDVWAEYCKEQNVPADDMAWLSEIKKYENEVLLKR